MKKLLYSTVLLLTLTAGASSCKKDWSCQCTDQSGNTTSTAINNQTLLNARAHCKDMNSNTGVTSEDCSLQ